MKHNLLIALASFALVAAARADVEDKTTKTFKATPGDQLVMDVDRGNIEVKTSDGDAVNIEVERKAGGSESKARVTLTNHVVTITQTGNKVEVHAEYKGPKSSLWIGRSPDLQVSYFIVVPRKFDVDLKTAGGHIKVVELAGKLNVDTAGGNLNLEKITGPVNGRTSGGHVMLAGAKGNVDLKTSGGNFTLSDIEGDVTANSSGGHIQASKITGKTVLKTSGGNIDAAGLIGTVDAATSGGHITVALPVQPAGDCSFDTSGGNVTIGMTEKVAVEIDARTDGGRVTTDLPVVSVVQGEQPNGKLRGKINGGGPLIKAHTSGGNIRIEKK